MMSNEMIEIRDNQADSRFETVIDGHLAEIVYRLAGDQLNLVHTFVPEELGGRGIAGRLTAFALDAARARGLKVIPTCPYIAGYIKKHPEYQDLLAEA